MIMGLAKERRIGNLFLQGLQLGFQFFEPLWQLFQFALQVIA